MSILQETIALANGVALPRLGFGTWQIPDGAAACNATLTALALGYRHIDTARPTATRRALVKLFAKAELRATPFLSPQSFLQRSRTTTRR